MSRILEASCNAAGIVTCEGVPIPSAIILSEGHQNSTGVLILQGDNAYYVTSSATDVKALIENMVSILNQIVTILSGLDAVSTTPGSQAAAIVSLTALKVQLEATKDLLK